MTLKKRLAISIALAFSLLFGTAMIIVFLAFQSYRKEEFKGRLEAKAATTFKLLVEVDAIDQHFMELIDENSTKLYNENLLIFDRNLEPIYKNFSKDTIIWTQSEIDALKSDPEFYINRKGMDLLGVHYTSNAADYYVLVGAEDKYGNNKLEYLFFLLLTAFLGGSILVWIFTYLFVKSILKPLDIFQQQITNISAKQLNTQLPITPNNNDEISLLTNTFNQMLLRIEDSFNLQKEFTANASHELRTPVARIALQLENLIHLSEHPPETLNYLSRIQNDVNLLIDLINSLLLFSKLSKEDIIQKASPERIDEIIFLAIDEVKKQEPDFELFLEIKETGLDADNSMELIAIAPILKIAFVNLLKNAQQYSSDKKANLIIEQVSPECLKVSISNRGPILTEEESQKIFEPFVRGGNSNNLYGSGLGLRIVKRILEYHNASIQYRAESPDNNIFEINFSI